MRLTHQRTAYPRAAEYGATIIEFAVVLPVFMLLVGAIFDYGRLLSGHSLLAFQSARASRAAAQNFEAESCQDFLSAACTQVRKDTAGINLLSPPVFRVRVEASPNPGTAGSCSVIVSGTSTENHFFWDFNREISVIRTSSTSMLENTAFCMSQLSCPEMSCG